MLKQRIEQDLKIAMLGGDKQRVSTLRVIKSAILYEEVAKGVREMGLKEEEIIAILAREAKKRQEAAEFYRKADEGARAEAELAEKSIIEAYLPEQLSDTDLRHIVDDAISAVGATSLQSIGQVISKVKQEVGGSADGARIARFVKEGLAT
jgi:uncharacterized protein YqeY